MKKLLGRMLVCIAAAVMMADFSFGAVQYWDTSAVAGFQTGDGAWSTAAGATNWTAAGVAPLSPWVNANDAIFPTKGGGASTVTLNTSLTSSAVNVTGSLYSIIITNGGRLISGAVAIGGNRAAISNRAFVVGGAGVTSLWATTSVTVGGGTAGASNNTLIVDGQGLPGSAIVTNSGALNVGALADCVSNEVQVVAGGRLFTANTATIGSSSTGNTLRVQGANSLWHAGAGAVAVQVGAGSGSLLNKLLVEDGAVATNLGTMTVPCSSNEVQVLSGGRLFTGGATLGYNTVGARGNVGQVRGSNSLWNATSMNVGVAASAVFNRLLVDDWAVASCGALSVGTGAGCTNNDVQVLAGGQLACSSVQIGGLDGISNSVLVQGTGSLLTATSALNPGKDPGTRFNTVVVDLGAVIRYSNFLYVGLAGANSNEVQVLGGGQLNNVGVQVSTIGTSSTGNVVRVQGSNSLWNVGAQVVTVGSGASARRNALVINDAGVVTNAGTLTVGSAGTFNSLIMSNRASLAGSALIVGSGASAYSNSLEADQAVLSTLGLTLGSTASSNSVSLRNGSVWDLRNGLLVWGSGAATNNNLTVDASSFLTNASGLSLNDAGRTVYLVDQTLNGMKAAFSGGALNIGTGPNLAPPSLVMSNFTLNPAGGSGGASVIGSTCSNSTVSILSGSLWNGGAQALTVGSGAKGTNNTLLIDGQGVAGGAVVTNVAGITVGTLAGSGGNVLRIANGGKLFSAGCTIGLTSSSTNTALVTGTGSLWQISGTSTIGGGGLDCVGNVLRVENGGVVRCSSSISFAANFASVIVRGGQLYGPGITHNDKIGNGVYVIGGAGLNALLDCQNSGMLVYYSSNSFSIDGNGYEGSAIATNVSSTKLGTDNFACSGGLLIVTNKGRLYTGSVYIGTGIGNARCGVSITTGGKLYSTGAMIIGGNAGSTTDNVAMVSGEGSLWNAGTQTLTIGNAAATSMGNSLTITQSGTVDNLGTLTVAGISNSVNLLGGLLGVINTTYTNGLFAVGDGVQAATLKSLPGGTLAFTAGLRINTNAVLTGIGAVNGAGTGVLIPNGATLAPGSNGVGALTIGGSNLTLGAGSVYRCEITDMKLGPGLGWDLVTVSSQLVLAAGAVIKMDSMGALAANFEANRNYNLRIATYGSLAGVNPATVTVNTDDFLNGGVWTLTNTANALWLICRDAPALSAADYTWKAPSNGNWDAGANWAGASAPAAGGGASLNVAFGDTGVAYRSTNNLGGAFQLNQLRFSSGSGVTNFLLGNQIALTNTGARVDYLAGETGAFTVSNIVRLTTDTEFGGEAYGGTLSLAGPVTNLGTLTKRGTWTLALGSSYNNIIGPVVVDGPDGMLRVDNAGTFAGVGSVTVSNGLIVVVPSTCTFAGSWGNNRRALVKGIGSMWTNNAVFTVSDGATNVQLVVDGGSFHAPTLLMFVNGSRDGSIIVTNGGVINNRSNANAMGDNSTNCLLQLTGANSIMYRNQNLGVSSGAGTGNRIIIEKKALIYGANTFYLYAAGVSNSLLVADGGLVNCGGANSPALGGFNVLGSNCSALVTGSGTLVTVRSTGSGISSVGLGSDYGNTMTIASNAVVSNLNLQVAQGMAAQNRLIVTDGGKLYDWVGANAFIANGTGCVANTATITGIDSLWDMRGYSLTVCQGTGTINGLLVENGGLVTNLLSLVVAIGSGASNNNVTVDNGTLVAGTATSGNALPNSMTMTNGGTLTATTLLSVTNTNFKVNLNGGTLNVKGTLVDNGAAFVAGDGALANTLNLLPGGTHTFVNGLVVTNGTTLAGSGLIQATSTVYGTLSPGGAGLGSVTNNGVFTLTNGATARFELAANTTPGAGWDLLAVTNGALNLGGTLVPVLKGAFLPAQADRFLIMTNQGSAAVAGTFSNGDRATIYAEDLSTRVGTFKIEKGTQGVVLTDYQLLRPSGALIIVR